VKFLVTLLRCSCACWVILIVFGGGVSFLIMVIFEWASALLVSVLVFVFVIGGVLICIDLSGLIDVGSIWYSISIRLSVFLVMASSFVVIAVIGWSMKII